MGTCNECNGRGEVEWGMVPSIGGIGGYIMETRPCKACDATGIHLDCRICFDGGEIAMEQNADSTWKLDGIYGPCTCAAGAAGSFVVAIIGTDERSQTVAYAEVA